MSDTTTFYCYCYCYYYYYELLPRLSLSISPSQSPSPPPDRPHGDLPPTTNRAIYSSRSRVTHYSVDLLHLPREVSPLDSNLRLLPTLLLLLLLLLPPSPWTRNYRQCIASLTRLCVAAHGVSSHGAGRERERERRRERETGVRKLD